MNRTTDLDRTLMAWLDASGPRDVPDAVVERALSSARRVRQRGGLTMTVTGRAWPQAGGALSSPHVGRALRLGLLAALALAIVGASLVVGTRLLLREDRVVPIEASPLLEREGHRAVRLDDGRILVVAGTSTLANSDAALIDPATGLVTAVPMVTPRGGSSTVTRLADGRILVAGGFVGENGSVVSGDVIDSPRAEVFDPATETFSPVGEMTVPHGAATVLKWFDPVSLVLPDGRVLVIGGTTEQEPAWAYPEPGDLFDPVTNTFTRTPALPCQGPDDGGFSGQEIRTANLLPDGRVRTAEEEL